jgi:hypothetical protein
LKSRLGPTGVLRQPGTGFTRCPCVTQCIDLVNALDFRRSRERPHWLLSPLFRFQRAAVRAKGVPKGGKPFTWPNTPLPAREMSVSIADVTTSACRRATVHCSGSATRVSTQKATHRSGHTAVRDPFEPQETNLAS